MKKLFSFVCALVCAMSLSARDLYLVIGHSDWQKNNERFAVYAFDSDKKWYDMTAVDGASNTYKATIDDKYPKVIFCRMNGTSTENNWDNKWDQTIDLTLPTNTNENCYTVNQKADNKYSGSWSVYGEGGEGEGGEGGEGEGGSTTTTYYMKHNWYGAGWSWKALSDNGDGTYSIRERYGTGGCNWNTSASDTNSKWISNPALVDSPAEADSAVFTLNPTTETITITKIPGVEVVINYIDITIRVKADEAPTIWWWGAGSKCTSAENITDEGGNKIYSWDNQPVMTPVDGLTGWYEWVLKDVNADSGVTFKINKGDNAIVAKESTCYDVNGNILSCPGATALANTEVENAVVKVIRNGQVLIVREGVTYNMMGQTIQ